MPFIEGINKVLVIGSGPIVIGQAAEFDYAGTQACRILKNEHKNVVLVNSNPATIMTDRELADEIYLEPLTTTVLKRIIEKERPDALLAHFGGQNGLTLATELNDEHFFEKMNVKLLGTDAEAIARAEDRQLFKDSMESLDQPCIPSGIAETVDDCLTIADKIGYPVIIRPAYTLGGTGGGVAYSKEELKTAAFNGLEASPINQVLIEKYIFGWKEIEFEVVRDATGKCIAVCSMENIDPVGIHTGDSIVAAPALTLTNEEYTLLHDAALKIASGLGVVGGCNCQFALKPDSLEYAVIEVNPRLSRSSALASKATGYPIAKVACYIALGLSLDEIAANIKGLSGANLEPVVNYTVVKLPRWPFDKFAGADRQLGTQMKATGEVMAIGSSFEMALLKAVRGAEIGLDDLNRKDNSGIDVIERIKARDDQRIFHIFEALKKGVTTDEIYDITRIDKNFLNIFKSLAGFEKELAENQMTDELYYKAKRLGYTDKSIKRISGKKDIPHIAPTYVLVNTCPSVKNDTAPYYYSDFDGKPTKGEKSDKRRIIVLGAGPIRIGQGIEFDYSSVHCVETLRKLGYEVIIINNNPETVSTDYDTADKLYFEPLTLEDVLNIVDQEEPEGVVVAFGGQTAIKLTAGLSERGIKILGTSAEGIDLAEDRARFDALLETIGVSRPAGRGVNSLEEALSAAETLGYPVLLRPSYVIGGQNMRIVHTPEEVKSYMNVILSQGITNPVLVDKYMPGIELEVDCISDGETVLIPGVMEHIERAGVHSGDSIAVCPPFNLDDSMLEKVISTSVKLALALGTQGLVNIQYLIWHNELYVIEVNPRASRTIPYISKVTGIPLTDIASRVMLGTTLASMGYSTGLAARMPCCAVKVPVFSFEKLVGASMVLGPEMKSTGEVLGVASTFPEALYKGLTSAGLRVRPASDRGALISVDEHEHHTLINLALKLNMSGIPIYATKTTASAIAASGIPVTAISSITDACDLIDDDRLSFVLYTGVNYDSTHADLEKLSRYSMTHSVPCLTSIDTANALADTLSLGYSLDNIELVDINSIKKERRKVTFAKMQDIGNDCIIIDNTDGLITAPESLALRLTSRHGSVGADGIALIENGKNAAYRMRYFNRDGSSGALAVNCARCVAKYLFDNGMVKETAFDLETESGMIPVTVSQSQGIVTSVSITLPEPSFDASKVPVKAKTPAVIDRLTRIAGQDWRITCLSVGNPHCVVFTPTPDTLDLNVIGPQFENNPMFPERVNTEFVRVIDEYMLSLRTFERGSGETRACGSGACAAVAAAARLGLVKENAPVTVKLRGGDLTVTIRSDGKITLTGGASLLFTGTIEI